jgi:hypothetical protein
MPQKSKQRGVNLLLPAPTYHAFDCDSIFIKVAKVKRICLKTGPWSLTLAGSNSHAMITR